MLHLCVGADLTRESPACSCARSSGVVYAPVSALDPWGITVQLGVGGRRAGGEPAPPGTDRKVQLVSESEKPTTCHRVEGHRGAAVALSAVLGGGG